MRFSRLLVLVICCILLASFAATAQKRKGRVAKPKPKTIVFPINADALKVLVKDERQKPLLVNFWATWCIPCREEFPDLVKIDAEYRPKSLDFFTVSLDDKDEIKTEVPKFLDSMKAKMPAYLLDDVDPEPAINLMDPTWQGSLPATFLFNAEGKVVFKRIGRVDANELRAEIDKLVKKPVMSMRDE